MAKVLLEVRVRVHIPVNVNALVDRLRILGRRSSLAFIHGVRETSWFADYQK